MSHGLPRILSVESGFSLIEVMIASGLISGILFFSSSFFKGQVEINQALVDKLEVNILLDDIRTLLNQELACTKSIRGLNPRHKMMPLEKRLVTTLYESHRQPVKEERRNLIRAGDKDSSQGGSNPLQIFKCTVRKGETYKHHRVLFPEYINPLSHMEKFYEEHEEKAVPKKSPLDLTEESYIEVMNPIYERWQKQSKQDEVYLNSFLHIPVIQIGQDSEKKYGNNRTLIVEEMYITDEGEEIGIAPGTNYGTVNLVLKIRSKKRPDHIYSRKIKLHVEMDGVEDDSTIYDCGPKLRRSYLHLVDLEKDNTTVGMSPIQACTSLAMSCAWMIYSQSGEQCQNISKKIECSSGFKITHKKKIGDNDCFLTTTAVCAE